MCQSDVDQSVNMRFNTAHTAPTAPHLIYRHERELVNFVTAPLFEKEKFNTTTR